MKTQVALISICKKHLGALVLFLVVLSSLGGILVRIIGSSPAGGLFLSTIIMVAFAFLVAWPIYRDFKSEKRNQQVDAIAETAAAMRPVGPVVRSPETEALRQAYAADIRACLADTEASWFWADATTVRRLYVKMDGIVRHTDIYVNAFGRIPYLTVTLKEASGDEPAQTLRLENTPYLQSLRAAAAAKDAQVDAFFAMSNLVVRQWTWDDLDAGIIAINAPEKFGPVTRMATLCRNKGGDITSMLVQLDGGEIKRVCRRTKTVPATYRQADAAPAHKPDDTTDDASAGAKRIPPPKGASRRDLTSTITPSTPPPAAAEATPVSEVLPGTGLLEATDDPPLSVEQIKQSVEQIRIAQSAEYAELAQAAAEAGDDSFTVAWPEGIQTKVEAEYLAQALVDTHVYTGCVVDAAKQTLRLTFDNAA